LFKNFYIFKVVGPDDSVVDFGVYGYCPLVDVDFPMVLDSKIESDLIPPVHCIDDIHQKFEILPMNTIECISLFQHLIQDAVRNQHLIERIVAVRLRKVV
jgi:hypothetical protein